MIYVPPEWAPQKRIWTAWPSDPELWPGILDAARHEIAGMVRALARGETVMVLAMGSEAEDSARKALQGCDATVVPAKFGDIWLRDTAPIFAKDDDDAVALTFLFNGWGGKYIYDHDDEVRAFVAKQSQTPVIENNFVLEGGAVEFDGAGNLLTTKSCLLNPNRNPLMAPETIEHNLRTTFGVKRVIWLEEGLAKDHTDGHIDNIARFIGPNRVLCQTPSGDNDVNAQVLENIISTLKQNELDVVTMPSPGYHTYADGSLAPASHMNYIIGNKAVVVPVYEDKYSAEAVAVLKDVFPDRDIVPVPAMHVLTGGGSFHCITQQEPL